MPEAAKGIERWRADADASRQLQPSFLGHTRASFFFLLALSHLPTPLFFFFFFSFAIETSKTKLQNEFYCATTNTHTQTLPLLFFFLAHNQQTDLGMQFAAVLFSRSKLFISDAMYLCLCWFLFSGTKWIKGHKKRNLLLQTYAQLDLPMRLITGFI